MVIEAAALFNGGPHGGNAAHPALRCTALHCTAALAPRTRTGRVIPPRPARWLLGMSDARRANWAGESKSDLVRDTETPRCTALHRGQ